MLTFLLAFAAGALSILSPCVLPILPVVFGAAAGRHRFGPVALAAGVGLSFAGIGLFVALAGFSIGLDNDKFRVASAMLLLAVGLVLLVPFLQRQVSQLAAPLAAWAGARRDAIGTGGLAGQFLLGLLLGAVWTPCVGPTLGAASALAARAENAMAVAVTMILFAAGAALPLLALGMISREALMRWRGGLLRGGAAAKTALGIGLVAVGMLVLAGWDKAVEAYLVEASPEWLTRLTTAL